ncbi:DUF3293 domain-containing protein [Waterburya agarophytonicola K14]|uniref:DUF3293 domain-containing protein n=1 Tax=Waterburya agarophytonicola KI4 TaxID=2874699 RepID=A0A964BS56_9CYAN|nr:DUF3293 domain-containing protein [Waterburya agarophytonicola]MCC0177212.1 DUF3293 domain-containing protein [Waterburya agarophytonicola KI4]
MSKPQFTEKEIDDLHQAYQDAVYEVYYNQKIIRLSIDCHNRELDFILEEYNCTTWALITAYNPYSQSLSAAENKQRDQSLIELLRWQSLAFLDAVGKDRDGVWLPEKSVFILGIEEDKAIAIGHRFQQNAIVFGELSKPPQLIWL